MDPNEVRFILSGFRCFKIYVAKLFEKDGDDHGIV